jgi:DNA-binding MarR family transcriptional regulator
LPGIKPGMKLSFMALCIPLEEKVGILARLVHFTVRDVINSHLATHDLDARQYAVLCILSSGSAIQQKVARLMRIDKADMVAIALELERRRLVTRRPNPDNRRERVMTLTQHGRERLRYGTATLKRAHAELQEGFTDDEWRNGMKFMHKLLVIRGVVPAAAH